MAGAKNMTTTQQDKLQELRDKKLDSVPVKVKTGQLDPTDFDIDDQLLLRPVHSETNRLKKIIVDLLNANFSRGGKYSWDAGFFLPGSPQTGGHNGWKVLQKEMLGDTYSDQLAFEAGLHIFEGAVAWSGRGVNERHIVCVKTEQLRDRQRAARDARVQEQFDQPATPEGVRAEFTATEERKMVPLYPGGDDSGSDEESGID